LAAPQKQPPAETATAKPAPAKEAAPLAATAKPDRSRDRFAATLIGISLVTAAGVAFVAAHDNAEHERYGGYGRHYFVEAQHDGRRTGLAFALGATALVTGGAGIALLLTRPEPEKPKVSVGVGPGAVMVSGNFP
jgi:hypothetical protein